MADIAEEVFGVGSGAFTILPRFAVADPFLNQLARFVHAEVEGGVPGIGLMADGLSRAMVLSMLWRHSSLATPQRSSAAIWMTLRVASFGNVPELVIVVAVSGCSQTRSGGP